MRVKDIYRSENELYLKRLFLVNLERIGIYLHNVRLSDFPVPHDHPWDFWTFVLSQGYIEHLGDGTSRRVKRFSFVHHEAKDLHWLELEDGKPAWTLFIRFKKKRDWGFMFDDGEWIKAQDVLGDLFV